MNRSADSPFLLTPGPLTISNRVRRAMLRDWGSRDGAFIALTASVRQRLVEIAGGGDHSAVLLQGSGTFAVEAALGSLVPPGGKALVLVNGAYGRRMARICAILGRSHEVLDVAEDAPIDPAAVADALARDPAVTHVAAVHCETTTGMLNPVAEIAVAVRDAGRRLLLDGMSAFGALPFSFDAVPCDAVVASANKCLQAAPGIGFVVAASEALQGAAGNAPSLSLDLADQWRFFEEGGQWRYTPPTHVLAALAEALAEHAEEGGVAGRGARYRRNCDRLVRGMRALGFDTLLPDALQAPIIVTFHQPADPRFDFARFYDSLAARGYLIYPGKLTAAETFRIGCIGAIDDAVIDGLLEAVADVLAEMGVTDRGRRAA